METHRAGTWSHCGGDGQRKAGGARENKTWGDAVRQSRGRWTRAVPSPGQRTRDIPTGTGISLQGRTHNPSQASGSLPVNLNPKRWGRPRSSGPEPERMWTDHRKWSFTGTSLVIQGRRPCTSKATGMGRPLAGELRSHMQPPTKKKEKRK